jgi:tRNA-Thr(GGU) m(6)t(6)A37 methyltransferase TsaA
METLTINPIGKIKICEEGMFVELNKGYIPALKELDEFSHVNVFWWFHGCDNKECRSMIESSSPYKKGPSTLGVFATRSPLRPNPIAFTVAQIISIDQENGRIQLSYIDANDGTPVIDLKPYTPSLDRVEEPKVPQWCSHWPISLEKSAEFNWEDEFNF